MSIVTDQEWEEYKKTYEKVYENTQEDKMRRELYSRSKAKIEDHNKKYMNGEVTWKMAINHLADLKEEEYASRCGKRAPPK
ncbi:cathepsin L-like proteinase [Teleopsis dalmanni]|uniref:cathepsin L-like proteinase n=1 Tax=Teleopsis dalmanni TaxID=139649 RepID=UPI0018CD4839|nr:cathepsin L-like proteinase [Teleopsis dalmanni]